MLRTYARSQNVKLTDAARRVVSGAVSPVALGATVRKPRN
jgi:hypothetical protein